MTNTIKPLSPQQRRIMQYLVDGLTMKEIQVEMSIKLGTIRKYLQKVRKKTEAKSLYQCIAIVVAIGEVRPTSVS